MHLPSLFLRRAGLFFIALSVVLFTHASRAALLAYEPFTNTVGADILGSSGGFGFANSWQTNASGGISSNTSFALTYTDGGGNKLLTNGGAAYFRGLTTANTSWQGFRQLAFSRGTNGVDGTNTWISFMVARIGATNGGANPWARGANVDHDFSTNNATAGSAQKLATGGSSGAATNSIALLPQGSGTLIRPSAIAFGGATNFVVLKIEHKTGALDNAFLFINPSLASEPLTNTANTNSLGLYDYSIDRLRIFVGGQSSAAQPFAELIVDEYRVGETFADVAPIAPTNATTATKLLAILPGQTFASGAAPGGAPSTQTNGTAFNVTLYAVNADGVTVDTNFAGAQVVNFSGASSAPDGSAPSFTTNVTFANGVATAATTFKKSQSLALMPTNATLTGLTSSNVTVVAGAATLLQIKTAADGSGTTIAAQTVTNGNSVTNFSVTFDAYSNFVANAAVTWSLTNKTGSVSNSDLVAAGDNKSAVFTAHLAGGAQVRADSGALAAATGTFTVPAVVAPFAKLQVLLPGETAAPGTASGKTGSPNTQFVVGSFTVTVNAVDTNWNVITTNDTVHVTTTDPADTEPSNAALVAGTKTFTVTPATVGAFTVTASDVSNGTISNGTSASFTVNSALPLVRVANTTLAMPPTPPALNYTYTNAFPGLIFTNPTCIVSAPGETNRLFILEKRGRVVVITNLAAPTRAIFLDITNRVTAASDTTTADERGLLSIVFHPGYATNGYFYLWFTGQGTNTDGTGLNDILARYQVSSTNANVANVNSEQRIIAQYDEQDNHDGGDMHFGPLDGYLYFTMGDEGAQNGTQGNAQRIDRDFFAGMMRIDVDKKPGGLAPNPHPSIVTNGSGQAFYTVPVDNPWVHTSLGGDWNGMFNTTNFTALTNSIRTEFWAVGLRNPFRFSFSPIDNTLYLGDVGEQNWEELDIIERGKNYGWNWFEGLLQRSNNIPSGPVPIGFTNTAPLDVYTQTNQADKYAVIGGYVYTGTRLSQLYGAYIYADYGKGNVWALRNTGTNVTFFQQLFVDDAVSGVAGVSTFGVDPSNKDMLYADLVSGTNSIIKRILYSTNTATGAPIPPTLADTGAFSDTTNLTVAPGVVAYDLNVPFWSDNASKTRWVSVPDTNLDFTFNASGNWSFPTGTVWIKHFELELTNGVAASRTRVETRLLVKNTDGVYGVTYRWGGSLTNATLVGENGFDENFVINDGGGILRTQVWHYPGRAECLQCHTALGGYALGFNTPELNKNFSYAGGTTNQLQAFADAGYFSNAITSPALLPKLAAATNTAYSLEFRARSYFAANCRHCHQGAGQALWDARIESALAQQGIVDGPLVNYFGDPANNRVVKAGSLTNSVLYRRISTLDQDHMPPLATSVLDSANVNLIAAWITNGLTSSLAFTTPSLMTTGTTAQVTLLGNFSASTNDVTADPETTFTSLNPGLLTVSATGLLTATSSTGSVQVVATFGISSITNTITVLGALPPTITTNPASVTVGAGSPATFTVAATGDAPLNYFWFKNSTNALASGTNATLNLSALTTNDSGSTYYCLVSNFVGTAASAAATLTVTSVPPAIVFPAAPTIGKGNVAVTLTDFAMAPFSGRTLTVYPPVQNFADQLTRISMMRVEPTNAPLAATRFFVADNNRNLYIVPKTNALSTNAWVKYINFEEVFPTFDNNPGYAGGLTAVAFDPEYATNGIFYTVHMETNNVFLAPTNGALPGFNTNGYTTTAQINPPSGAVTRVAVLVEWTDTNVNNATFEGTAREILRMGFFQTIHPMGDLLFNPLAQPGDADYRNLYIACGDGRAGETAGTTHTHPQQLDALAGKILRITPDLNLRTNDVLSSNGRYRIPSTGIDPNPFANTNANFTNVPNVKKEIFAYGFRNPHRFSWDTTANKLIVDDIGLNSWEEVNLVTKGANYGWAEREGPEQMLVSGTPAGVTGSQQTVPVAFPTNDTLTVTGLVSVVTPVYPVATYSSRDGDAISSGFVYRGSAMPALVGKYVFGDITTARLFYCDLAEMIAADDGNRNTVATIRELQVIYNSAKRRLYDIVGDAYTNRGGFVTGQRLPGSSTVALGNDPYGVAYGKGRADIRLALGDDKEIYVISKSDGMIRKMVSASLPPTGGTNVFYCATNQTLKIDAADLLATGTDPENDALALVTVNLTTTNNVTLTTNGNFIFYTNVNFAPDRFTYTLTDTHFGSGTGAVVILPPAVTPTNRIASVAPSYPGSGTNRFALNFSVSGVAGYQYTFQYATNLPGNPWFNLDTKIFGATGTWQFTETNTTDAARFYRVRWP